MRWQPQTPSRSSRRGGFVLIAVLVVVVLLTLAAYQFSELMLAEFKAADSYVRSAQARALADSGGPVLLAALGNADTVTNTLNGNPYDNPAFQGVLVHPSPTPRFQGRFSVIAQLYPDDPNKSATPYRFGVIDEAGKINPNALLQIDSSGTVLYNMLMTLPNMTDDVANSIIDYIDADDDTRSNGAESDYYSTLTPPYQAKNAPLDSIEELLLVKGVTPQLLLGNDQNRNGVLDPGEDDGSGVLDQGWSAYLTVYSREQNVSSQGTPRLYVNDSDLNTLQTNLANILGQDLANFIIAYRLYGPSTSGTGAAGGAAAIRGSGAGGNVSGATAGAAGAAGAGAAATTQNGRFTSVAVPAASGASGAGALGGTGAPGSQLMRIQIPAAGGGGQGGGAGGAGSRPRSISSLYELINTQVSIPASTPNAPPTILQSPLNDPGQQQTLLPLLLDQCTTVKATELPPRINVNTASQTVLSALPGITDTDMQNILSHRPDPTSTTPPDPIYQTPAWLITQANMSPRTLQSLEKYITAQTQVYRAQVVGYFDGGGPSARVEVVIDTNQGNPRILYYRDLTELGKGYDLTSPVNGTPGK